MALTLRQSMSGMHSWVGLVFSWLLFFMFLTGTAGYFDTELDRWMKPELPAPNTESVNQNLTVAQRYLQQQAPAAERWHIRVPGNRDAAHLRVSWRNPQAGERRRHGGGESALLDGRTGAVLEARDTGGGQALYRLHYRLAYLPRGVTVWLIGLFSFFMLLALLTGIVIHRNIFRDLFTFRPGRKLRSWLDMHNLMSVISLPFQLMITYSGLVFFLLTYMPLIAVGSYGMGPGKMDVLVDELFPRSQQEAAGQPARLAPLSLMAEQAQAQWGQQQLQRLVVEWPGDINSRVQMDRVQGSVLRQREELLFTGTSGELLTEPQPPRSGPLKVHSALLGLHEGNFAGPLLRWLYFGSGLLGTGMIATGLILWSVKRRARQARLPQPAAGFRLVEGLNIGTLAGLPIAIAGYFWANRLLPLELENRAQWEIHSLFLIWLLMLLYPLFRSFRRGWIEQCWIAAAAFGLLPLLNALTTERHLGYSLSQRDWALAGVDLTMLAFGLSFALAAWLLQRHWQEKPVAGARSVNRPLQEATA